MANKLKSMHQIRQVLEHLSRDTSIKKIAAMMGISRNTVKDYRDKFLLTRLTTKHLLEHSDADLKILIQHNPCAALCDTEDKRYKEMSALLPYFTTELRKPGVTRLLLWQEYLNDFPNGYRYTRFCHFLSQLGVVLFAGRSDVLHRIPTHPINRIKELLPQYYKA